MNFNLTETSPRVLQPDEVTISLKPHQLACIHKIIEIDNCNFKISKQCLNENLDEVITDLTVTTNIGILGDYPGSGKTLTMLGALCILKNVEETVNSVPNVKMHWKREHGIIVTKNVQKNYSKTNLIVVPTNLVDHWIYHLKETLLSFELVVESELSKIIFDEYDVVLCPANLYNKLILSDNFFWNRVIIDEADSIQITKMLEPVCRFLWLITSTYLNLPKKRTTGFIKDLFSQKNLYSQNVISQYYYPVIVQCNTDFVKASFELLEPVYTNINCISPEYISAVFPFLSQTVAEHINSGNIQGAIYELGGTVDSPENIITLITKSLSNKILKAKGSVTVTESLDLPKEVKELELKKLNGKVELLESRKTDIINSIKNHAKHTCSICLGLLEKPTIVGCCSTVFCGECLLSWTTSSDKCPICRSQVDPKELKTIGIPKPPKQELPTKIEALLKLLETNKGGRFLIFADTSIFKKVGEELTNKDYKYGVLTAMRVQSTLQKFRKREINIILLSPIHNGAGIEIPEATDVILFHKMTDSLELQTVGRAQRPKRLGQLRVWNLVYSWEN